MSTAENKNVDPPNNPESSEVQVKQEWKNERYEQVAQIGVGAYGVVFKAKDLHKTKDDSSDEERYVAMKCLRVENTEQGMPLSMVREIALLQQLETKEHPNVVKLLDICLGLKTCHETQLMLVFEHIDQDLDMYLRASGVDLEEDTITGIMHQMLLGIEFLHTMRVIHRDLKPQNILITTSGKIKIADFGLARIFSVDMALTAVVVTLWYRAPEVLLQDSYATPVDLWSLGCIFAELYNKRPLFRGSGDVNQLRRIFDLLGRPSDKDWPPDVAIPISAFPPQPSKLVSQFVPRMGPTATDLFLKLLAFDPLSRPSTTQALKHSFFQGKVANEQTILQTTENPRKDQKVSSAFHRRRMPYTQNMGLNRTTNDENIPSSSNPGWYKPGPSTTQVSTTSRHPLLPPSIESAKTEDSLAVNPNPGGRKRAFGNPLPLNVKDGASGELLPINPYHESAFLTPPSDLASSSDEDYSSRSPSDSDISQSSALQSYLEQQSTGLVLEASVARPDSVTPSKDSDLSVSSQVIRRSRVESEGHSRMSWTCDPTSERENDSCFLKIEESTFQSPSCSLNDSSFQSSSGHST